MKPMTATILLINGTSSAGKSSLAWAFQASSEHQWVRLSIDDCFDAFPAGANLHTVPYDRLREVFYQSLKLWADQGFDLIVDAVFEEPGCVDKVLHWLHPYRVYLIGLHCPLEVLEQREVQRANRPLGLARSQYPIVHTYCGYDLEIDSYSAKVEDNVAAMMQRMQQPPQAFAQLQAQRQRLPLSA